MHEVYQSQFSVKSSSYCLASAAAQREFDRPAVKIPTGFRETAVAKYHRQEYCRVLAMTQVLVVEDSEDVLEVLRLQLEGIG